MGQRRVVLLPDEPADIDRFDGAHRRVAASIAQMVTTQPGGRTVALEGSWGAGKSTVVRLLDAELRGIRNTDTLLVTFDAWSHQGDPLRRAFLETHLKALCRKGWINRADWDTRAAQLAGRYKESTVTTTPRLTRAGQALAFAATITPAGLVALNTVLGQPVRPWPLVAASVMALSVVLVVLILLAVRRIAPERHRDDLDPLSPLASSHVREEMTTTFESGEPTSLEFETFFQDLLENSLVADDRRLVVVLDNLDRVNAEDARTILATLQTFRADVTSPRSRRLWTIVPFDATGIRALWSGAEQRAANGESLPREFLDKLFDITFHVPPLIVSDWHEFLLEQLEIALPDTEPSDRRAVLDIYAAWALDTQQGRASAPLKTPRTLKRFINEVGAAVLSNDTLALPAAAAFVLLRRGNHDVLRFLREERSVSTRIKTLLGEGWRAQIAGAYFGTAPERGLQLLLDAPIRDALLDGDETELQRFSNVPGFFHVLAHCHIETWAENGAAHLSQAAATLESSGLAKSYRAKPTVSTMITAALAAPKWEMRSERGGRGFGFLAAMAIDHGHASAGDIIDHIVVGEYLIESLLDDQVASLSAFAVKAGDRLSASAGQIVYRGSGQDFLEFCSRLGSDRAASTVWPLLRYVGDTNDLTSALRGLIANTDFRLSVAPVLDVLLSGTGIVEVGALASNFAIWFSGDVSDQGSARQVLTALERLRRFAPERTAEALRLLSEEGRLLHCAYISHRAGDIENAALAILLHIAGSQTLSVPPPDRYNEKGYALVVGLLQSPGNHPEIVRHQARWLGGRNLAEVQAIVERNPSAKPWADAIRAEIALGD